MSNSVANPIKTLRGDQRKIQMNVLRESVAQSDFIRKPINSNWSSMYSLKVNLKFYLQYACCNQTTKLYVRPQF